MSKDNITSKLPKVSIMQMLNLCIGAIGLQFAWAMQINLTGRVIEPLGATALILGLMWLAGPITGILVQPVVGAASDSIWTKFGRRRPFLLVGAILCSFALIAMPYAPTLIMAACSLWIIDICVNVSQTPHRALIPDLMPGEQHALANAFISFGVGVGAVVAFGLPFILKHAFNYQMDIKSQFVLAAIVISAAMAWTCFTTPENKPEPIADDVKKESPFEPIKNFIISSGIAAVVIGLFIFAGAFGAINFNDSSFVTDVLSWFVLALSLPMLGIALKSLYTEEIYKLCAVQYLTWLGVMCLFIYFNNFVVHNIYNVPDLSTASEAFKNSFHSIEQTATNLSGFALAIFNLSCLVVSIPLGWLCNKLGKKNIHGIALILMALGFLGLAFIAKSPKEVLACMALAGIGWASILTIPYSLLTDNIKKGTEASSLGKFNLFIAGPQILSSILVGRLISNSYKITENGITNHWEYAFIAGGAAILVAALISFAIKNTKIESVVESVEADDKVCV